MLMKGFSKQTLVLFNIIRWPQASGAINVSLSIPPSCTVCDSHLQPSHPALSIADCMFHTSPSSNVGQLTVFISGLAFLKSRLCHQGRERERERLCLATNFPAFQVCFKVICGGERVS